MPWLPRETGSGLGKELRFTKSSTNSSPIPIMSLETSISKETGYSNSQQVLMISRQKEVGKGGAGEETENKHVLPWALGAPST